jgi:sugar-specific transcriptional regulator TrmB
MSSNILLKKIVNLGLTKKEAQVYLATLENGQSPASHIAQQARINRVTTYGILEKLFQKGFVEQHEKNGTRHFQAIDPAVLNENLQQKAEEFAASLPLLKSIMGHPEHRPTVRFFEGIDGIKRAYKETLKSRTEICNYANSRNIRNHWPDYDESYVKKRKVAGVFLRGIFPKDKQGKQVQKTDKDYHRETKLLPADYFNVENEIKIFDGKMLITSFEPHTFAIIIESSAVYETQKQIFEIVWNLGK